MTASALSYQLWLHLSSRLSDQVVRSNFEHQQPTVELRSTKWLQQLQLQRQQQLLSRLFYRKISVAVVVVVVAELVNC